ncbi:MAG: fumarate hydratase C-terminal domain-containing protein [Acidiferrobacterales bacterium]|nr:fumarate hydratase C-terminal domain-containing protein [Acidiferrobacterales bacterium]
MSNAGPNTIKLRAPVSTSDLRKLQIGDVVYIDGVLYTGREGAYRKIIDENLTPPLDLLGTSNVNFHCSPAAAVQPDGSHTVGAVTATASFRFSKWMRRWFDVSGCKVVIGKGGMPAQDYSQYFVPAGAVYLTTVGYGTGALLGRGIRQVSNVFWLEELGIAQAIWVFDVAEFGPFLVESDLDGNSLFEQSNKAIDENIETLYKGLKEPALRRFGETTQRTDEVI